MPGGVFDCIGDRPVAHSLSAKKRVRQTAKRNARNRTRKDQLKTAVRGFNAALTANDPATAAEALNKVSQRLDRNASKGTIHKNAAARKRSRLTKRLNLLKSGAKGVTLVAKP
jgi:small subunit ribosomal protein S20